MLDRSVIFAAVSAALLSASAAYAAPPKGDGRRVAGIALRADEWDASGEGDLRRALQNTLGIVVKEPSPSRDEDVATVVVRRRADGSVTIAFVRPDGREVERTLDLPADRALATETIALAAGNLVRDEASELVAALTPPPPPAPTSGATSPDVASAPPLPATRRLSCSDGPGIFFGADLAPGAGTSSVYPDRRRTLSFNFVAGYSRGLNGFELGVGANIESAYMCGTQIAAGANVVLGDVRGLQLAVADVALGDVDGAQIGITNFAKGDVHGAQIATVSVGGGSLEGAQISVVNLLAGQLQGNQTGVVNLTAEGASGAQIGVVNLANGNVDGAQIGVTNIANGEVSGAQIGVVNYADVSDYPVGVVSVVRHGRTSIDGWVTDSGFGMAGVRHGGRVLHNIYGAGYRAGSQNGWSFALGLGGRVPLATKLYLDVETIAYWIQQNQPFQKDAQVSSIGASLGYSLTPVFGVFGGPTFNVLVTPDKDFADIGPAWGTQLLYEDSSVTVRSWPGATLGLRASL
jgi:hypothetical protein